MTPKFLKAYASKMGPQATRADALAEVHDVVVRVARNLAPRYTFGYHTRQDIEGQAVVEALEAVSDGSYDVTRPLENFLYVHVKNRLKNYLRKHYFRSEASCTCCDPFDPPEEPCKRWHAWNKSNAAKLALMQTQDAADSAASHDDDPVVDEAALSETLRLIDEGLPPAMRADYLRMRAGVSVPKGRRQKVREAVLEIIGSPV